MLMFLFILTVSVTGRHNGMAIGHVARKEVSGPLSGVSVGYQMRKKKEATRASISKKTAAQQLTKFNKRKGV